MKGFSLNVGGFKVSSSGISVHPTHNTSAPSVSGSQQPSGYGQSQYGAPNQECYPPQQPYSQPSYPQSSYTDPNQNTSSFPQQHSMYSQPASASPFPYQQPPNQPSYQQPSYQQPSYQQSPNQQPSYQQPSYQQPSYQQPSYQQPPNQQPSYQQPSYQQPSYQQPSYQQPPNQQPSYQQPPNQQPSYQQPPNQQPSYQQPTQHMYPQPTPSNLSGYNLPETQYQQQPIPTTNYQSQPSPVHGSSTSHLISLGSDLSKNIHFPIPVQQKAIECITTVHQLENIGQTYQQVVCCFTELRLAKDGLTFTFRNLMPIFNDFLSGNRNQVMEQVFSRVNQMTASNNPFQQIQDTKEQMLGLITKLMNLQQTLLPMVPQMVHFINETSTTIKIKVGELKVEVDKVMHFVDIAKQIVNGINIFDAAKIKCDEVVAMIQNFIAIITTFENIKNEVSAVLGDWQQKAMELQNQVQEVQMEITDTLKSANPQNLAARITNPNVNVHTLLGFISNTFKMAENPSATMNAIVKKPSTMVQTHVQMVMGMIQKMEQDATLVPKWMQQLEEAKNRLFEFKVQMEKKLQEVHDAMDFVKNTKKNILNSLPFKF